MEFKAVVKENQKLAVNESIRTAKFVRNKVLRYWMDHRGIGKKELYRYNTQLRDEYKFVKDLNSHACQASVENVERAIKRFFDNCKKKVSGKKGYPRFKNHSRSVEYKQSGWKLSPDKKSIKFTDKKGIGKVKLKGTWDLWRFDQKLIKRVRIVQRADGYYVQFCVKVDNSEQLEATGFTVGLDVGLQDFYTDSDGYSEPNPRFYRKGEKAICAVSPQRCQEYSHKSLKYGGAHRNYFKRLGKGYLYSSWFRPGRASNLVEPRISRFLILGSVNILRSTWRQSMMFNRTSRVNCLSHFLAGTATVAMVVVVQTPGMAVKTPQQVAEIASPITVQVNSPLGDGSGVIIARNGNTYWVLTVNHVVEDPQVSYWIQTHEGESYTVTEVIELQSDETEPDLAVVQFESTQEYPVATLGNSDQAVIGAQIYVYGYPATGGLTGSQREPELSPGLVTSRPKSRPEGYILRYQAVTWSGMSGGPVFDGEGRLVGLHGQGEFGFAQTSAGDITPIKTGFNAAVPINLFITQLTKAALTPEDLTIDETPTLTRSMSLENPENAQAFYFRGLTLLDQEKTWEAIADFNYALELEPNNPEAYFNRGLARTQLAANLNEPTRGPNPIEDYTQAIRLNPGYADAYYNRGLAYIALKQYEQAIADFQQATELYQRLGREESYQDALDRIEELKTR